MFSKKWHEFRTDRARVFFVVVTGLVCVIYLVLACSAINSKPLEFDEGWNLQAPYNLAEHGVYASFGGQFGGATTIFDPYLSTGPTVSLPVAAAFYVFGFSVFTARIVLMIIYLTALLCMSYYVFEKSRSPYAALAPLGLLLVASPPINFRLDMLGEIAAIGAGVASLIFWRRKRYFWAGICTALAILAKMVLLLLGAAGFLLLAIGIVRTFKKRSAYIDAGKYVAGIGLPLVLWEGFKFVQLGSFAAYKHNWHEYINVFKVGGSGLASNGTVLSLGQKIHLLATAIRIPQLLLAALCMGTLGLIVAYRSRLRPILASNMYGLAFLGIYLAWWIFMSNGGFVRYVVPMVGIGIAVFIDILLRIVQIPTAKIKKPASIVAPISVTIIFILCFVYSLLHPFQPNSRVTLAEQEAFAHVVAQDSTPGYLVHLGWWQSPEIMLLAGKSSRGEDTIPPGTKYNLVLSSTMRTLAPQQYQQGLKKCYAIVYQKNGYVYCRARKPLE